MKPKIARQIRKRAMAKRRHVTLQRNRQGRAGRVIQWQQGQIIAKKREAVLSVLRGGMSR